MHEGEDFGG